MASGLRIHHLYCSLGRQPPKPNSILCIQQAESHYNIIPMPSYHGRPDISYSKTQPLEQTICNQQIAINTPKPFPSLPIPLIPQIPLQNPPKSQLLSISHSSISISIFIFIMKYVDDRITRMSTLSFRTYCKCIVVLSLFRSFFPLGRVDL